MRARLLTVLVSLSLAGAASANVAVAPAAPSGDLPMTDGFATAIGQYRDCVLSGVDRSAAGTASAEMMADAAVQACADANMDVRAQLLADIQKATPGLSDEAAIGAMEQGMAVVEPMIAEVARGHAQEVAGQAFRSDAPELGEGTVIG